MPRTGSESARDSRQNSAEARFPIAAGQDGPVTAAHWTMHVDRGPDWLFVRPGPAPTGVDGSLCDTIWELLRSNSSKRLVVELDSVESLDDELIGEIARLGSRVQQAGGLIRVCGLSRENLGRLQACPSAAHVPHFASRAEAVAARRPGLPR